MKNNTAKMLLVLIFSILNFSSVFAQEKTLVAAQRPCLIPVSEKDVVNFNIITHIETRIQGKGKWLVIYFNETSPVWIKADKPKEELAKFLELAKECKM